MWTGLWVVLWTQSWSYSKILKRNTSFETCLLSLKRRENDLKDTVVRFFEDPIWMGIAYNENPIS